MANNRGFSLAEILCLAFGLSALVLSVVADDPVACLDPGNDTTLEITSDTVLCPRIYGDLKIEVDADDVSLDCTGSILDGGNMSFPQTAVYISNSVDRYSVRNCHIKNYEYGVENSYTDFGDPDYIINNTFEWCYKGVKTGFNDYLEVENNTFLSNRYGYENAYGNHHLLKNNNFTNQSLYSIHLDYAAQNATIVGNYFTTGGWFVATQMRCDQIVDLNFFDNVFYNINGSAILVSSGASQRFNITGNTIINVSGTSGMQLYGIKNAHIQDNYIRETRSNGIMVSTSNGYNVTITNNTVLDAGNESTGIYLLGLENSTVTGNIVHGCGYPLKIYGTDMINMRVYNNIFNKTVFDVENYNESNTFNASLDCGTTNIAGGPCMGGNLWLDDSGTGYSQTCSDGDSNGICDDPYSDLWRITDYLPLKDTYNSPPTLSFISFSPDMDSTGSTFTFTATYTDVDNDAPSHVRLVIDGSSYDMSEQSGSYGSGAVFSVDKSISTRGTRSYYVTASDGNTAATSSTYSGPIVTSSANCGTSSPPYEGGWTVSSSETCGGSSFLASSINGIEINDGVVLTVDSADVYVNQSKVTLVGSSVITLNSGGIVFI